MKDYKLSRLVSRIQDYVDYFKPKPTRILLHPDDYDELKPVQRKQIKEMFGLPVHRLGGREL